MKSIVGGLFVERRQSCPPAHSLNRKYSAADPPQGGRQVGHGPSVAPPADLKEEETCHDDGNEACCDGTGLLVWPGSRLLASFLADPLGARRFFPQALATSRWDSGKERRSTRRNGCDGSSLVDEGQNVMDPSTTPGPYERHDELILPGPNGEIDGRKHVFLANRPLQGKGVTAGGLAIKQTMPPATEPVHGDDFSAASQSADTHRASQKIGELGAAPCRRTTRRTASSVVLELGAGTGICGMVASLSFGCQVTALCTKTEMQVKLLLDLKRPGILVALGIGVGAAFEITPSCRNFR